MNKNDKSILLPEKKHVSFAAKVKENRNEICPAHDWKMNNVILVLCGLKRFQSTDIWKISKEAFRVRISQETVRHSIIKVRTEEFL
jgi:hypothetical protein